MKHGYYESRREQNAAFARRFCHDAKVKLNPQQMALLRSALKDAAVCGACEERGRILQLLPDVAGITARTVEDVLGYRAKARKR